MLIEVKRVSLYVAIEHKDPDESLAKTENQRISFDWRQLKDSIGKYITASAQYKNEATKGYAYQIHWGYGTSENLEVTNW